MSDGVKETLCTGCTNCTHLEVCKYKEDFLNIYETLSNASIHKKHPDGTTRITPITNFVFIDDIAIKCCYFKED